ncbi:TerB family tellurite resistance protein [Streptomyces sodiiphilus]|uniref:TerB family tellurite resistance protein n=1 Tax=Streptomyces sodiiphilus TaxID=226217 RepID=A0ABN2PNK8_9ACTN
MVHSRSQGGRKLRVAGIRTAWRVVGDGEFYCPGCGGDRCYQQLAGRRRLAVLGVPLLSRGAADPVAECASCRDHFPVAALAQPTTVRLAALLRDAVHAIALALLAAGGDESGPALETAVDTVRGAGFPDCSEDQLLTLLAALKAGGPAEPEQELRACLTPLAPHLAGPGRENLLLEGARIALTNGHYSDAERDMLSVIGGSLGLAPEETDRLLTAAMPT